MALDFAAGCLGGCAGLLVGYPMDTVKVHLQTQDFRNPKYSGTYDCIRKIIVKDSIKGLYRGMSSPLVSISALNAIVFGVYGNIQRRTTDPDSLRAHFYAGTAAGLAQSLICSPMELVKTRLQLQHDMPNVKVKHEHPWSCLRHIAQTEGRRGVFKGLGITILRDVPGFSSYFVAFELMMSRAEKPSAFYTLMAGGFAGTFSWVISFPIDVVKSRLQCDGIDGKPKYSGAFDCTKQSYKAEGLKFFTRGLGPTLLRAFPMNAVCFLVVSYVMKFFDVTDNVKVNFNQSEQLPIVESHPQSFIMSVIKRQQAKPKHKMMKYMIFLDGFHEASCHAEMMDLSDGLREKRSTSTYFYKINDGLLLDNLTDDDMRTPLFSL